MGPRTKVAQSGPAPRRSSQGSSPLAPIHERPPEEPKDKNARKLSDSDISQHGRLCTTVSRGSRTRLLQNYYDVAESSVSPQDKKIDELVTMVNAIACKQQKLEECLTAAVNQNGQQVNKPNATPWRRRNKQPIVC